MLIVLISRIDQCSPTCKCQVISHQQIEDRREKIEDEEDETRNLLFHFIVWNQVTGRVLGSVSSLHSYHPHSRHDVVFLHLLQTLEKICQYLEIHQQEERCGDLVLMIPALEFQNLPRKYETETRCIIKSPVV